MIRVLAFVWVAALCLSNVYGQDYKVAAIPASPTAEGVSPELLGQFAGQGVKVTRGSRTACELWLHKDLEVVADFKETADRIYPFQPGQLIGLVHYPRKNNEFREQEVQSGWYTLRFELQPVDGNHVGTSPTRDFLLLVKAENDQVGKKWETKELLAASAEVSGGTHPAMMCLQRTSNDDQGAMSLKHDEEKDWWILRLSAQGKAAGKPRNVFLEMVVIGHAAE